MLRPLAAALLVSLFLVAAVPPAAADLGLPAPLGTTERVVDYMWTQDWEHACHPYDPLFSMASLSLPSSVTHTPAEGGTRYDVHVESLLGDAACPALDISFVSEVAPWTTEVSYGSVTSACGATGRVVLWAGPESNVMGLEIELPEACAAGVTGHLTLYLYAQPIHPDTALVCVPVGLGCVGAAEYENPGFTCSNGRSESATYVSHVAWVSRRCDHEHGGDYVRVDPIINLVWVEAREDACVVHVEDWMTGTVRESVPCPAELGAAIYGVDWGHVIP